ncbi:hypothetical protein ALT1000_40001 [Alteromonas macleodii]
MYNKGQQALGFQTFFTFLPSLFSPFLNSGLILFVKQIKLIVDLVA